MRTLYTEEGGGLYSVCQTPPALSYAGFKVHKGLALLETPYIMCHQGHKSYLITDRLDAEWLLTSWWSSESSWSSPSGQSSESSLVDWKATSSKDVLG